MVILDLSVQEVYSSMKVWLPKMALMVLVDSLMVFPSSSVNGKPTNYMETADGTRMTH